MEAARAAGRRKRSTAGAGPAGSSCCSLLVYTAVPMVWMLLTSIKSQFRGHAVSAGVVAERADARQLPEAARSRRTASAQDFLRFFWNSIWVSTVTTILGVIVAVPAAYAFSRFRFPGRQLPVLLRAAAEHVSGGRSS